MIFLPHNFLLFPPQFWCPYHLVYSLGDVRCSIGSEIGMFLTLLLWVMIHVSHKKVKMKKTPGDGILATDDLWFFFKRKKINIKLRMMHLPEGRLKPFTQRVWPAHRIGCVHWYKSQFLGFHTILQVFVFSGREKEEGGEHVRQRLLVQETESSDTVLEWDSSAVFLLWPSCRVSNQKLWNGAMNFPGRLMSSLLGKKVIMFCPYCEMFLAT